MNGEKTEFLNVGCVYLWQITTQLNNVKTEVSLFFIITPRHCPLDKLSHLQNISSQPFEHLIDSLVSK